MPMASKCIYLSQHALLSSKSLNPNHYSTSDLGKLCRISNSTHINFFLKKVVLSYLETPAQLFKQETKIPPFTLIYNEWPSTMMETKIVLKFVFFSAIIISQQAFFISYVGYCHCLLAVFLKLFFYSFF